MKFLRLCIPITFLLFAGIFPTLSHAQKASLCVKDAQRDAKKFLDFYSDNDDRVEISSDVKELPSMRNPAAPKQIFHVLEVWGYIYKGQYRMRFIYYYMDFDKSCTLMGQEILEYAKL